MLSCHTPEHLASLRLTYACVVAVGRNVEHERLLGDDDAHSTSPDRLIAAQLASLLFGDYGREIEKVVVHGIDNKLMPLMQKFYREHL